ncbi:hypothetical protein DFH07DRAFT_845912 [Mycena maculata]|uniref:Uncharacterized protein n=1 Tax=Mycena maculata TaxID=230809 RepID=A0AAD7MUY4_9AGAR|nr:hypothetical protein DFH07DRAFT_845912 [Mycena maculata]
MAPTRLRPGQYHHHAEDREWNYYETPSEAPHPRKSYGFYRSVVDFGIEAKGQVWDLFLAMREPMMQGDTRPGILIIARKDYAFSVPPGYRPRDMQWTAGCESSSLVKVGDYRIPDNGCLEFRDKIARGIRESAGHFEVLSGAGDGIYPVEIIKDAEGLVACVKVRFDGQGDVNLDNPGPIASCNSRLIGLRNPHSLDSGVIGEPGARKNRRKSTSDMLDITKGFLKDVGNAARRVL